MKRNGFNSLLIGVTGSALIASNIALAGVTLVAVKTNTAPRLDGAVDATWSKGTPVTIQLGGGKNFPGGKTKVTLKALYTDSMVYFLAQYKDPTRSYNRTPWQKQKNGSWKKLATPKGANPKGVDESKYHEDKFSMMWNISTPAFETKGCDAACHLGEGEDPYGLKYTPKAGQLLDLWYMRSVRTSPLGYMDDDFVDGTRFNKVSSPSAGRKSDPNTGGGGSKNNENSTKTQPLYALPGNKPMPPFWIMDSKKIAFDNTKYKTGDLVPSVILGKPYKGDRDNISGKMTWKRGVWTVEIARKRVTGSKNDIQFNNLKKTYAFGVSAHDNVDYQHARDVGVEHLKFKTN
jgi:Ethylbenzene dehydrogenase